MNTSNVSLRWVFAAALATCPVVGIICSIAYRDISMLWASLLFVPIFAIALPVGFVLIGVASTVLSRCVVVVLMVLFEMIRFGRRQP